MIKISMIKMRGSIPGREGRLACHTLGTWGQQEDPKTSAGISVQPKKGMFSEKNHAKFDLFLMML